MTWQWRQAAANILLKQPDNATDLGPEDSHISDGVTGNYLATLAAALTGNHTYTLQDADMTLAALNLAQTWSAIQQFNEVVGIGGVPIDLLTVMRDQNAGSVIRVRNLTSNTGAFCRFLADGGTNKTISIGYYSAGYTGILAYANRAVFQAGSATGGMLFDDRSSSGVGIAFTGTERVTFGPTGKTDIVVTNATTNAVDEVLTLDHESSGTPAAGFGARIAAYLESSTTARQIAGAIDWLWTTATHASRTSKLMLSIVINAVETSILELTSTAIVANKPIQPPHLADASAPNDSIYYSTTANRLVYKDSAGTVNNLY